MCSFELNHAVDGTLDFAKFETAVVERQRCILKMFPALESASARRRPATAGAAIGSPRLTREEHLAATLQAELDLAVATSSAVPGLRHPPWVTDARAKTLFRDVDLAELRRQHEDSWRARGVPEKKLPPIQMHKTATGMVILSEGTSGVKSAAELLAAKIAAEEAKRPPKGTVRFGLPDTAAAATAAATSIRPIEAVRDPAQAAAKLKNKRIVRFKYAFRPAPWVLPRGEKRPPNAAAAHEAGVRSIGRVRLPVAPR